MATPIAGVTYSREYPSVDWVAPGRPTLTASVADREALITGTYQPGPTSTGITSLASDLTLITSSSTYNSSFNGQTISNRRFQGIVTITGQNITFINCLFEGPSTVEGRIVILTSTTVSNILFRDCTFAPRTRDYRAHTIQGHDFKLLRCELKWGVDAVSPTASTSTGLCNVTIEACWLHDLAFFSPDPTHNDNMTHSDVIQWHGGANLTVDGNKFDGYLTTDFGDALAPDVDSSGDHISGNHWNSLRALSCLMISSPGGYALPSHLIFTRNWVNGGAVGINGGGSTNAFLSDDGSKITNNWFGQDWRLGPDFAILIKSNHVFEITGNHLWVANDPFNTGTDYNIRRNA